MLLEFKNVRWKNLLSYGDYWSEFNFSNGVDLVLGSNGNGKSVLSEAIFYSLFGKPYRKIKLGSLVNRMKGKNLEVQIEFTSNNKEYIIKRGNKPAIFEILEKVDDEYKIVPQRASTKEYQTMLENEILNVNETIFRQLVILGANLPSSKPFLELSQQEKEEIFQVVTDTSIFGYMNTVIKEKLHTYKDEIKDLEYKKEILESSIKSEEIMIKQAEDRNLFFENNRDKKIQDTKDRILVEEKEIENINSIIENLKIEKNNYIELQSKIELYQSKLDERIKKDNENIKDIQKNVNEIDTKLQEQNEKYNEILKHNVSNDFENESNEIKKTLEEIHIIEYKIQKIDIAKKNSIECKSCGHTNYLDNFLKDIIEKDIEQEEYFIETLKTLKDEVKTLESELNEKVKKAQEDKDLKLQEIENNKKTLYKEKTDLELKISEIKNRISSLDYDEKQNVISLEEAFNKSKSVLIDGKHQVSQKTKILELIQKYKEELNELQSLESVKINYDDFNNKKQELTEVLGILSLNKDKEKEFKELLELIGSGNLKGYIIKSQIPFLNKAIQYFLELFSMLEYNFVIDENFKEQIIARDMDNEFNQLSNGQKARISFSIMFAFLKLIEERNGVKTNLLILDEILDSSVDNVGRDDLLKIIKEEFSDKKDIVIISHNPEIKEKADIFNRVVTITKDDYSRISID